jgi:2,3-bisphosphoglycerate-independent phosphoglycerate mutase
VKQLLDALKEIGLGELVTFVGRYYAMDRDKRWDRVQVAVDALVEGKGEKADDPVKAIEESYANGVTDEFVKPLIFGDDSTRIQGMFKRRGALTDDAENDTIFTYNYRSDRMRELVSLLAFEDKPIDVKIPKGLVSVGNAMTLIVSEHYHHVSLQPRVDPPCRFPPRFHGQRPRRVVGQAGCQADPHCR